MAGRKAVEPRTGAERYLRGRLKDDEYAEAYHAARERIAHVDAIVREIEARREDLGLTKAALARRAGLRPEVIRRLLTTNEPNPTLSTLMSIAKALDLQVVLEPKGSEDDQSSMTLRRRKNSSRSSRASA